MILISPSNIIIGTGTFICLAIEKSHRHIIFQNRRQEIAIVEGKG